MRIVRENTESKTAQTSFLYVNGRAKATGPKGNWFLKILNLLILNT